MEYSTYTMMSWCIMLLGAATSLVMCPDSCMIDINLYNLSLTLMMESFFFVFQKYLTLIQKHNEPHTENTFKTSTDITS